MLNLLKYNTVCPTRYRTRHFFNNFTTNEDIATKYEADYKDIPLHFSHNERTPVLISLQYLHWCYNYSVASGTLCIKKYICICIYIRQSYTTSYFLDIIGYNSSCMFRPNYMVIFRLIFKQVKCTIDNAYNLRDLALQELVKIIVACYTKKLQIKIQKGYFF